MVSEAKRKANRKWDLKHLEQVNLSLPQGTKAKWKLEAEKQGLSMAQFVQLAVNEKIDKTYSD